MDKSEGHASAARTAPSSRQRGTAISGTTLTAATARTRTRSASATVAQPAARKPRGAVRTTGPTLRLRPRSARPVALVLIGGLGILYLKIQRLQRRRAPGCARRDGNRRTNGAPGVGKGATGADGAGPVRRRIDCGAALRGPF